MLAVKRILLCLRKKLKYKIMCIVNRIIQIFFIVFSLMIFCDKLWADEVPYARAIPSVEDEITGSWLGKGFDTLTGQAYEIELVFSKNFNNQFECTMQISDYKSVYKHCFAISTQDYTYYLKGLDSSYLSGIQSSNPVLQKVWLIAMLTPIAFNKILAGTAIINTSKLLGITLNKENNDKDFAKISLLNPITQSNIKNNLVEKPVLDNKIPSSLKANAIFNAKELEKTDSYRLWYRIPNWSAGSWVGGNKWIGCAYSRNLGCQVDKLGNIWDTTLLPTYYTSTNYYGPSYSPFSVPVFNIYANHGKIFVNESIIFACNPEDYDNQDSWTYQIRRREIFIANNIVESVIQDRLTETFRLIKPGKMNYLISLYSHPEFDVGMINNRLFCDLSPHRQWERLGHLLHPPRPITLKLKQPFKPRNLGKDGTDLKADFIKYLQSHNLNDLIPN